jgi:hypothetical protein
VGKAAGANASGGVPTIRRIKIRMVGTAQGRLCPPYGLCRKRQRQALLHWAYDSRRI